jgi:hypothetical protein
MRLVGTAAQGVKSADKMDDVLKTKLNAKVDGGEAENLFSGTDQTIDNLIANMEIAQGVSPFNPPLLCGIPGPSLDPRP